MKIDAEILTPIHIGCDEVYKSGVDYISENNTENVYKGILTSDGVHLNNQGNKLIADEMLKFLN